MVARLVLSPVPTRQTWFPASPNKRPMKGDVALAVARLPDVRKTVTSMGSRPVLLIFGLYSTPLNKAVSEKGGWA